MGFTKGILAAALCFAAMSVWAADENRASDEAILAAAESLIKENAATTSAPASAGATQTTAAQPAATVAGQVSATAPSTTNISPTNEAQMPLVLEAKKVDKSMGTVVWRLIASIALIAVIGGSLVFATRRWARQKDKGGNKARIEMMHQFHLGPKKSLALIRVSGEAMLVGITDHSINMIKPVTLIDDELEHVANKDFNNFLEDEFSIEDVRSALNARM